MRAALAICLLLVAGCTANGPAVRSASSTPTSSSRSSPHPVSLTSGGVIEYALPDSQAPGSTCSDCGRASATRITAGADGNIWFTDSGNRKVGRITPAGSMTEFGLPDTGGSPYGIAVGPDKNIWFTVTGVGQGRADWIGRIAPSGEVTKFSAGSPIDPAYWTAPEGIAAGPDGNIWFTEAGAGRIGRMTPAGIITEFPIPGGQAGSPRGIVAGPDGNLWFIEAGRMTAIGKITPSGAITEYRFGAMGELYLSAIVAGPDGNLWFAQSTYNGSPRKGAIGRITPNGVITTFDLPQGSLAYGLAIGPDRNIWFTDSGGNAVGRMSTAGTIRQFALPRRNAQPLAIAAGADGRMWFTEGSWIASIGATVPEAKLSSRVLTFNRESAPNRRAVEITNTGDGALKISGVAIVGSDRDAFTISKESCSGQTVGINASCQVLVAFAQGAEQGLRGARLAITDNATGSPHAVSLVAQLPECKLPLFEYTTLSGEFLSLRDGTVVADPAGRFVMDGMQSKSLASPVLRGYTPATYNRVAARWVPGGAISPDGLRYAYIDYAQPFDRVVHVVDIATGRDRTLPLAKGPWALIGFTGDGIYIHTSYEGFGSGLTLINPDSGAARTVFSDSTVHLVSGQVAWIATRNLADTLPGPPGIGGNDNEVQSRDLITSKKTTWLYRPGSNLYVLAASHGSIAVSGYDIASSLLLVVTVPGQAIPITVPETSEPIPSSGGAVGDDNGWWFGSLDGVYLWTPRTGAILVSELTAAPAGACA
jgi:streptogramin lyase